MTRFLLRAAALWAAVLAAAVLNGTFREAVLVPALGAGAALPASGLLLCLLVVLIASLGAPWLGPAPRGDWWAAGSLWFGLTLAFELFMGRVVLGRPWTEVLGVFRFWTGDLFGVVLLVTGLAPRVAAGLRGLVVSPPGPAPRRSRHTP